MPTTAAHGQAAQPGNCEGSAQLQPQAERAHQAPTAGHLSENAWPSALRGPTERGAPRRATPPAGNWRRAEPGPCRTGPSRVLSTPRRA
eukprot:12860723-Alexandrium_andersonii.AAC.1